MPNRRLAAGVGALMLVVACTGGDVTPSTTPTTSTTIGFVALSTPPPTVEVDSAVDEDVAEGLVSLLDSSKDEVEELRGLRFLDPPRLALVPADELAARHGAALDAAYDRARLVVDSDVLRLLGLLGPGEDLRSLLADVSTGPGSAFYDRASRTVVVDGTTSELGPVARGQVVRALVQALTDQYHRVGARTTQLERAGRHDEAAALSALFESDASYFQLVYLQGLSEDEQREAAEAAAGPPQNVPPVLAEQLTLTAERGLGFVEELMRQGGTALVDSAYENGLTTEGLLHPERLLAGEGVRDLPEQTALPAGYRVVDEGSLGEMGLRSLLAEALPPDILTQTVDGWGGDRALTLADRDGNLAWVYAFKADSVDDAVEVAQGFLDHTGRVLGQPDALAAGGGVEFTGRPYVFVDRDGDGLAVVVAGSVDAGRELAAAAVIP